MAVTLMWVHALSALHAGTGQGVGTIDLPIARERATNLPVIPGSSIKGCLKDTFDDQNECEMLFGTPKSAGLLQLGDARLLLLPVRCLGATFMWVTSPYVLRRLRRDAEAAALSSDLPAVPDVADGAAQVAAKDALVTVNGGQRLVLEDLDFVPAVSAGEWATWISGRIFPGDAQWQAEFEKRFAIVDDKSFFFLVEFATEVTAHVEIDDKTGTVKPGALWYQESLPAETVLVSVVRAEKRKDGPEAAQVLEKVQGTRSLQLGGKATTGLGLVRVLTDGGTA